MKVSLVIFANGGRYTFHYVEPQVLIEEFHKYAKKYPDASFYTVNRTYATPPPEGYTGSCWCPYCRGEREFIYNQRKDVRECKVCGISRRNFYVRKFNR